MPYAALQFGLYDTFHKAWTAGADAAAARRRRAAAQQQRQAAANTPWPQQDGNGELAGEGFSIWDNRRLQAFTCGLAAGLLAKLGSHPLDVAKKRYQVRALEGVLGVCVCIYVYMCVCVCLCIHAHTCV